MSFVINSLLSLSLLIDTISMPFDKGANKFGSKNAPAAIIPHLDFLQIDEYKFIDTEDSHYTTIFENGYNSIVDTLSQNKFPLLIGGDHTIAISSIFASNEKCKSNNETLGILWCDAHADFNTVVTSQSKNLHGMPIAILCGHTLESLSNAPPLDCEQFAYYGLRDMDTLEFFRVQEHNMLVLEDEGEIDNWINMFDKIHISFDIDCLDPSVTKCVNTPVPNGKTVNEVKNVFNKVKASKKLMSLDIVEYNPEKEVNKKPDVIIDLIKEIL